MISKTNRLHLISETSFFFTVALLLAWLSQTNHWADSELWSLSLAGAESSNNSSLSYKWLFNVILSVPLALPLGNLETIHGARLLFALMGTLNAFFFFKILQSLLPSSRAGAWVGVSLYLLSPWFLTEAFTLRSDVLAGSLQLLALWHLVASSKEPPTAQAGGLALIFNLLLLLSTPKAVIHLGLNFIFLILWSSRQGRSIVRDRIFQIGFLAPLALFALLMAGRWQAFQSALVFLQASATQTPEHAWEHLIDGLTWSVPLICLGLTAALVVRKKTGSVGPAFFPVLLTSALASFAVLLYPDRLPFFLFSLSAFPFLALGLLVFETGWLNGLHRKSRGVALVFCSFAILTSGLLIHRVIFRLNNQNQIQAVTLMESYLASQGNPVYYDATGVLPRQTQIHVLPAPQHPENLQEVVSVFERDDVELIFFGNKLFAYFPVVTALLQEKSFIRIGPGVYARSHLRLAAIPLPQDEWGRLCEKFQRQNRIWIYAGPQLMLTEPVQDQPFPCPGPEPDLPTDQFMLAFTGYGPFQWLMPLSFPEIFDYRSALSLLRPASE